MKIRKLKDDDIGKIVAIIHDVMGPEDAKKALTDIKISLTPNAYKFEEFYVVDIDGEIAAAGGFWSLQYDPDIARLDWFVVPKKHQRKGFGKMLMNFIVNAAKTRKLKLIVAELSDGGKYKAAREFLSGQGYEKAAGIKNYWEDGSGVVYLVKRL
jgi:ribosomal protein S18 acetylase RimI-like enzyme